MGDTNNSKNKTAARIGFFSASFLESGNLMEDAGNGIQGRVTGGGTEGKEERWNSEVLIT